MDISLGYMFILVFAIFFTAVLYNFTGFKDIGLKGWKYIISGGLIFLVGRCVWIIPWESIHPAAFGVVGTLNDIMMGFGLLFMLLGTIKIISDLVRS